VPVVDLGFGRSVIFVCQLRIGPCTTPAGRASARGSAGATKSVVISCLIFAFQQFAGINAIIYFSSSVFAQVLTRPCSSVPFSKKNEVAPASTQPPLLDLVHQCVRNWAVQLPPTCTEPLPQAGIESGALASAGVGAINVLGTLVAGALVDRAGRKQLLIVSFLGQAAAMLCMSAGLALPQLAVSFVIENNASDPTIAVCCLFNRRALRPKRWTLL
jgi:Sugar (and other) transporter